MAKRAYIAWYFVLTGLVLGTYASRVPELKSSNHLSNTTLGVALLFGAIGAIAPLPLVTHMNKRFGSAVSLLIGSMLVCICLIPIGVLGYGLKILIPAFVLFGFAMSLCDISMTGQGVVLEKRNHYNVMGSFHALASAGSMIGALVGGTVAYYNIPPLFHFAAITAASLPPSIWCFGGLFNIQEEHALLVQKEELLPEACDVTADAADNNRIPLLYLCFVGFLSSLGEGSIADWTTIYLTESLRSSPLVASIGFAAFQLTLTCGALLSDHLSSRFARSVLIRSSSLFATAGIVLLVAAPSLTFGIVWAVAGLGIAGAGLSVVSPIVASAAGCVTGTAPVQSFAYITSVTYFGFKVGAPCLGGLADVLNGLRWSLLLLAGLVCLVCVLPCHAPDNQYHRLDSSDTIWSCSNTCTEDLTINTGILQQHNSV